VLPTPETVLPTPTSPYGVEKLYGEHLCRLFHSIHGMETVSLRYFNVYGPGQNPLSEYAAVIPRFITMLIEGRTPAIFGDGTQTRDFLYVGDVIKANVLAAETKFAEGQVLNIAGGHAATLNDLTSAIRTAVGAQVNAVYGPERAGDIKHSSADIRKAKEVLGFAPDYDLERGLRETVAYYRAKS
jgi:nucleoside-diphosphate-sugar epimerase